MKRKVFATHPNALNIAHPMDGKLRPDGSFWEDDGFTARMLADGAVTEEDPAKTTPPDSPPAATKPPPDAKQ